jgi:hypothetical protein
MLSLVIFSFAILAIEAAHFVAWLIYVFSDLVYDFDDRPREWALNNSDVFVQANSHALLPQDWIVDLI